MLHYDIRHNSVIEPYYQWVDDLISCNCRINKRLSNFSSYRGLSDVEKVDLLGEIIILLRELIIKSSNINEGINNIVNRKIAKDQVAKNLPAVVYGMGAANLSIAQKKAVILEKKAISLIAELEKECQAIVSLEPSLTGKIIFNKVKNFTQFADRLVEIISLSLKDFSKRVEFPNIFNKSVVNLKFNEKLLIPGDILLSYKTKHFLKKNFLSKLISIAEGSSITHSIIVYKNDDNGVICINATGGKHRYDFTCPLSYGEGEMYFVMRPIIKKEQKDLLINVLDSMYKKYHSSYSFSELKCWSACVSGIIYTRYSVFTCKDFIIPNPFQNKKTFYCSELIDEIYKKAGILLVPRAEHDRIIGPSEILYSPHLKMMGVLFNENDRNIIKNEKINI